ncbi:MAG: HU family DNA-binding protein [Deltaproteobacteria bacterium]|nr:HU family DNA-binding protein [Deltaproteobacteria bacterium]
MNKAELIECVAKDTALTKSDAERCLNSMTNWICQTLRRGDKVSLVGFGTFAVAKRAARRGRNPQTGQEIHIKACRVPKFKPGKYFRDLCNRG